MFRKHAPVADGAPACGCCQQTETTVDVPTDDLINEMLGELPRWAPPPFPSAQFPDGAPERQTLVGKVLPTTEVMRPVPDTVPSVWTSEIHLPAFR
jgi:hypothetical protein